LLSFLSRPYTPSPEPAEGAEETQHLFIADKQEAANPDFKVKTY
jgi:hypothetical protein